MIQVGMFTWKGTTEEAQEYAKKYEEACKKNGLVFKGVYAPLQEPYHYSFMVDNEKQDMSGFSAPFRDAGYKPPQMGTWITKYYAKMEW
jgi:hypothetical protein